MFKIGDIVEIIGGDYSITIEGSYGQVMRVEGSTTWVNFTKVRDDYTLPEDGELFDIATRHLGLKFHKPKVPYEDLYIKMAQIYARQERRYARQVSAVF